MCDACDSDEPFRPREAISPEIIEAARAIERAMPGEPVPETAWAVFFNQASGSITWPHYQRMRTSFAAAFAAPPAARLARLKRRTRTINCEEVL
jgi:hypothetical protein